MNPIVSSETRASLLVRMRDHQDLAWRDFFMLYTPVVCGYCLRRGLQPSDAEDVTQEVFIEVARCISNFEYQSNRGRFRDWLATITWRRLARFWQSQKKAQDSIGDQDFQVQSDPEWLDEFQAVITQQALENIQSGFAQSTWQLFLANWQEGLPAAEVAQRFGVPIEMVYNAKSRALKQLEAEVLRLSDDCAWLFC